MNYYQLLGVNHEASQDEIKKSYRNLVKQHHPDKGGDEATFKKITEAYENLSDPQKRDQYDVRIGFKAPSGWDQMFNQFGGNFSEMFNNAFNQSAKGPDVTIRVNLTLEEVYYGTTKYIETGTESFNISIPKGITNGAKLRVRGKGRPHPVNSSAPNGDAIIIMQILLDPNLIVNGSDIWIDYTLPFYDMLLGGKFEIETPVNKVNFIVPQNSYDGKILRITGMGMPIYNTETYGNMMVKLRTTSVQLTEDQLDLVKKIKDLQDV